jgi:hypothetical protein
MSDAAAPLPPATTIAAWRILLRGLGAFLALFVVCFWAAKGYHRGWTKNQVAVKQIDPVTELEFETFERRFVPGLDYLGGGILLGGALFGATFLGRRRPTTPPA